MALTPNDIAPVASAAPATPAAAPAAPAPANDPTMAAVLGVVGGDEVAAKDALQKVLAQQGGSPKTAPGQVIEPLEPKDPKTAKLPDEVLSIPAFRALLKGSPPAVSNADNEQGPEIAIIERNVQPLLYSGFGFYRNKADTASYLYNGRFIQGDALKIADEKGKLDQIVPPFSELKSAFDAGLAEGDAVEATAPAPAADVSADGSAPPQPAVAPAPASSTKALTNARLKNLVVGAPTSGAVPGQGRILSNIVKPVI